MEPPPPRNTCGLAMRKNAEYSEKTIDCPALLEKQATLNIPSHTESQLVPIVSMSSVTSINSSFTSTSNRPKMTISKYKRFKKSIYYVPGLLITTFLLFMVTPRLGVFICWGYW